MPRPRLTQYRYAITDSALGPRQYQFANELLTGAGVPIHRGPRGALTYGNARLTQTSYNSVKRRLERSWTRLRVVEDFSTMKMRVLPRERVQ